MPVRWSRGHTVNAAFIWACIGMASECIFTSVVDAFDADDGAALTLRGYSYAWMLPLYAALPFGLEYMHGRRLHWVVKCGCTTVLCMVAELGYGMLLRYVVVCPWEASYRRSTPFHLDGLVRLDWLPLWMVYSIYVSTVWRWQRGLFGAATRDGAP